MLFLWEQGRPLSVPEILEAWDEKTWTKNYIRNIMCSLEQKGAVEFYDLDHRGKRYARRFKTILNKDEYFAQLAEHSGVSVGKMLKAQAVALVTKGDKEGMEDLIRELEDIIEEYRSKDDGQE